MAATSGIPMTMPIPYTGASNRWVPADQITALLNPAGVSAAGDAMQTESKHFIYRIEKKVSETISETFFMNGNLKSLSGNLRCKTPSSFIFRSISGNFLNQHTIASGPLMKLLTFVVFILQLWPLFVD